MKAIAINLKKIVLRKKHWGVRQTEYIGVCVC